jgi:NADP-dependent 3-hydroxy acid dehydrogenase YdfG
MRIEGSVVVVTGASSGIGRATALELARRGARVGLLARRTDALEEVAAQCGPDALVLPADVADAGAVDGAAAGATGVSAVASDLALASTFAGSA